MHAYLRNNSKDYSNGAYFWDGADIKINDHRTSNGVFFTDITHDIYNIAEHAEGVNKGRDVKYKFKKTTYWNHKGKKTKRGEYTHVFDSTAAYGGTIFWKYNRIYMDIRLLYIPSIMGL